MSAPRFSPDGKLSHIYRKDQGRTEIFVQPFPASAIGEYQTMVGEHLHGGATEKDILLTGTSSFVDVKQKMALGWHTKTSLRSVPLGAVSFCNVNFISRWTEISLHYERKTAANLQYVVVQNWAVEKK